MITKEDNRVLVSAEEAMELLEVSALYFVRMFDRGVARPELARTGKYLFDLQALRQVGLIRQVKRRPIQFPEDIYATVDQAISLLGITRKTFYNRVNAEKLQAHKYGKRTYVKLTDLYANDELF